MYKHHKESLQIMAGYYREQKGVIAFIFGGSEPTRNSFYCARVMFSDDP